MKSVLLILALSAAAGAAVGASIGVYQTRLPKPEAPEAVEPQQETPEELPVAVVPETVYNFGTMEQNTSLKHSFIVQNTGSAPLKLQVTATTCKCTVGNLAEGETETIEPGDETTVELEWTAKTGPGPFRHGATLVTSDPFRSRFDLNVEGTVVESTALRPNNFGFGTVRTGDSADDSVYLMSFVEDEIKVLSHEFIGETVEGNAEVSFEDFDPEEIGIEGVRAALKITATVSGGDSIGPFYGSLNLETSLAQAANLSIPLSGRVVGDVSVFGRGWNERLALLALGTLRSSEGGVAELHLNVRGEKASSAEFTVERVDPPAMKVEVGQGDEIVEGLFRVPLTVTIPPGTAPFTRSGGPASDLAEIVLGTNLPNTSEVRLGVRVAVQP
ncbi:MAG: DUF1573 domain-containing protein [Planctomycetota bacterium]